MARKIGKLTNVGLRKLKGGMHSDGGGLYAQISVPGKGSWLFRYSVGGRERYCGLGSIDTVSLADARQEAQRCRQIRLKGGDPIEARKAERAAAALAASQGATFKEAAEQLIGSRAESFRGAVTEQAWRQTLADYAYPTIGHVPVHAITTDLVVKVLEPLWQTKPDTARNVRSRIEAVWNAYKARNPEAKLGTNPAAWRGHLDHVLPKPKRGGRRKALPYAEVGAFIEKLRARPMMTSDLLEFVILTAARSGEATGMRRREIDFDKALWTIPAERMKMERPHLVPLSQRALAILRKYANDDDPDGLVFTSRVGSEVSSSALRRVHKRMGFDFDTHGFRSTFRDWAGDCTAFSEEICEFALAHVKGDAAEAAYRRSTAIEKRRELMKAWADYCDQIRPANVGSNVVPIRAAV